METDATLYFMRVIIDGRTFHEIADEIPDYYLF